MIRLNLFTSTQKLYFNVIHSRNLQATGVREAGRLMALPLPIQIQRHHSWGALQQSSDYSPHVLLAIPSGSHAPLAKEIFVFSKGISRQTNSFKVLGCRTFSSWPTETNLRSVFRSSLSHNVPGILLFLVLSNFYFYFNLIFNVFCSLFTLEVLWVHVVASRLVLL